MTATADSPWVVAMAAPAAANAEVVGPKLARLAELQRAGFQVPTGYAVTVDAYLHFVRETRLDTAIAAELAAIGDGSDLDRLEAASARIRERFAAQPLPEAMRACFERAYETLCFEVREVDKPVAVRSSAVGEDAADHSFAGQYETFLGVSGLDAVDDSIRRAWSSLFSARAIGYRARSGLGAAAMPMAVGVLELVRARAAGVAFSVHPLTGRRDRVVVEGSWGYGEAVVGGLVVPDHAELDKDGFELLDCRVADKTVISVMDYRRGAVVERPMPPAFAAARVLDDDEIAAIARSAVAVEAHYGYPVDIEWVLQRGRREGDTIVLVQARPVTAAGAGPTDPPQWDPVRYALRYGARMT
jgi:pyruvate,water dikinase